MGCTDLCCAHSKVGVDRMKTIWLLIFVSASPNLEIIAEQKEIFNTSTACEQAAKGRQLFLENIGQAKYVCVMVPEIIDAVNE